MYQPKTVVKNILLAALLCCAVTSCKKKDGTTTSPIVNKWRVVDAELGTQAAYYEFFSDGTYTFFENDSVNARAVTKSFYAENDAQLIMQQFYVQTYRTKFSADTCYLYESGSVKPDVTLVKSATIPAEKEWTPTPVILDSTQRLSDNGGSLAMYGSELVLLEEYITFVRNYNVTTKEFGSTLISQSAKGFDITPAAVCWGIKDGDAAVYRFSLADLSTVFTSSSAPANFEAMAASTTAVYCYDDADYKMYTYSIAGDNFDTGFKCARYQELAYSNGYLYGTREQYIDKIDLATKKVVKTWKVLNNNRSLKGIATDGTHFYVEAGYGFNITGHILKLTFN